MWKELKVQIAGQHHRDGDDVAELRQRDVPEPPPAAPAPSIAAAS